MESNWNTFREKTIPNYSSSKNYDSSVHPFVTGFYLVGYLIQH
jgi:hypothetical protein